MLKLTRRDLLNARNGALLQFLGEDSDETPYVGFNNNLAVSASSPVTMSMQQTFNIDGADAFFSNNINTSGSLAVDGATALADTLTVTNGATLEGTLDVTGVSIFATDTTVSGTLKAESDLDFSSTGGNLKVGNLNAITVNSSGDITRIGQSTPSDTHVLTWDGTNNKAIWSAGGGGGGSATDVNSLTDVTLTNLQSEQILKYDGTNWINEDFKSDLAAYAFGSTTTSYGIAESDVLGKRVFSYSANTMSFTLPNPTASGSKLTNDDYFYIQGLPGSTLNIVTPVYAYGFPGGFANPGGTISFDIEYSSLIKIRVWAQSGGKQWRIEALNLGLTHLVDTNVSSPTDGQSLIYDSATQKWVPGEPDIYYDLNNWNYYNSNTTTISPSTSSFEAGYTYYLNGSSTIINLPATTAVKSSQRIRVMAGASATIVINASDPSNRIHTSNDSIGVGSKTLTNIYGYVEISLLKSGRWYVNNGSTSEIKRNTSSVTVSDSSGNGNIKLKTSNTERWEVESNGHLLPVLDATYNIGNSNKNINNLFLSNSGIYFGTGSLNLNVTQEDKLSYNGDNLATESYANSLGGATTLDSLTNVTITSVTNNQFLKYNQSNTEWENISLTSSDVSGLGSAATLDVGTTANQIVQLDGNAKLPAVDGSQLTNVAAKEIYSSKNSNFTAAINYYYSVDTTNGAVNINLPQISTVSAGERLTIKFRKGSNLLTILPYSGDTIEDINTLTLTDSENPGQSVTLISDGSSSWEII